MVPAAVQWLTLMSLGSLHLKRPPFWFAWANGGCAGTGMSLPAFMIRNLEVCDIPEPALQHNAHTLGNTYDTAYYALAYQHSAPLVPAPRDAPQVLE